MILKTSVGELDVHDHPYNGSFFTWYNHQVDNSLARKLDPALACNHCPILINLDRLEFSPPKPLKFFFCWTKHSNFLTSVEDSWNEDVVVDPMIILFQRLKRVKKVLGKMNLECYSAISRRGPDVTKAILYFFQTRKLLPAFNCSSSNGNQVKHYRPISCCSAVYKCVTRIIMNRLTSYLPLIISKNQSAFVQMRNISDNILLAQELVCGYGREFLSLRCAIKVDLQKVFDSLHWGFLLTVLEGYFKGARGVRQGYPLSPYVFVMAVNELFKIIYLSN
ncbi:hypothetical protein J1N35_019912 [Gossypium stocksii]|uniref:Reverse transcriptase domain-containing protein n=1 Tax=Gossypium stocksii TaxID=47602 RepID=A0A9D3ZYR4_9ROSI|nr:hypothetical protein J1N35_019912 [Gossypium stocksii]